VPPQAKVHNLVLGRTWVDSFGTFLVKQHDSGLRVELDFKPCGWFGSNQYEFEGYVYDKQVRLPETSPGQTAAAAAVWNKGRWHGVDIWDAAPLAGAGCRYACSGR